MKIKNDTLIKKWEELRLEAYLPTPNDVPTIGWGHTKGVKMGQKITKAQAQTFFDEDVTWVVEAIRLYVRVKLNQNQFDALASLIFNIGATAFKKSTLLRRLNNGDYDAAAEQFLVWNKQNGKVLRGLVNRRQEEYLYFLKPVVELKPLITSKEAVSGATAVATGLSGLTLPDIPNGVVIALSVALVTFGLIVIVNRLWARKTGAR